MSSHGHAARETQIHIDKIDIVIEEPKGVMERLGELFWGAASAVYEQAGNIFDAGVEIVGDAIEGARHGLDRMTFDSGMMHPRDDYAPKSADLYGGATEAPAVTQEIGKPEVGMSDLFGEMPSHDERKATADAYAHAENAPGIRAEIDELHDVNTRDLFEPMPRNEPGIHGAAEEREPSSFEAAMRQQAEMAPPVEVQEINHVQEQQAAGQDR